MSSTAIRNAALAFSCMLALGLAACGQGDAPSAPAGPTTEAQSFSWSPIAPTTIDAGPPAVVHLRGGRGDAILTHTAVAPGNSVRGQIAMTAPAGQQVRLVLQRHCNPENGDAFTSKTIETTGERQVEEIEMTFAEAYDCVRLSFYPVGDAPIDVTVSEISFTKTS